MPICTEEVTLTYNAGTSNAVAALDGVSLTIEDGSFVGVMGHTGCGKSTLLQLLAGLIAPTSGRVLVDGEDINSRGYDRLKLRGKMGVVFQYPECQLFETTVEKDVAFGLKHAGLSAEEVAERVRWALTAVGFDYETVRRQSPLGLSGGEKRRAAIAGILAMRPKYLLLDEPIAGLDPIGRTRFIHLLNTLHREGMTIFMISHNADSLAACARRILVLEQGRVIADGSPREVFRDVEWMERHSLGVSQSRKIGVQLALRGVPVPEDVVTYEALKAALLHCLKDGGSP